MDTNTTLNIATGFLAAGVALGALIWFFKTSDILKKIILIALIVSSIVLSLALLVFYRNDPVVASLFPQLSLIHLPAPL